MDDFDDDFGEDFFANLDSLVEQHQSKKAVAAPPPATATSPVQRPQQPHKPGLQPTASRQLPLTVSPHSARPTNHAYGTVQLAAAGHHANAHPLAPNGHRGGWQANRPQQGQAAAQRLPAQHPQQHQQPQQERRTTVHIARPSVAQSAQGHAHPVQPPHMQGTAMGALPALPHASMQHRHQQQAQPAAQQHQLRHQQQVQPHQQAPASGGASTCMRPQAAHPAHPQQLQQQQQQPHSAAGQANASLRQRMAAMRGSSSQQSNAPQTGVLTTARPPGSMVGQQPQQHAQQPQQHAHPMPQQQQQEQAPVPAPSLLDVHLSQLQRQQQTKQAQQLQQPPQAQRQPQPTHPQHPPQPAQQIQRAPSAFPQGRVSQAAAVALGQAPQGAIASVPADAHAQLLQLQREKAELKQRLGEQEGTNSILRANLDRAERERIDLRRQLQESSKPPPNGMASYSIADLQKQSDTLRQQLAFTEQEVEDTKRRNHQRDERLKVAEAKAAALQEEINKAEAVKAQLSIELEEANRERRERAAGASTSGAADVVMRPACSPPARVAGAKRRAGSGQEAGLGLSGAATVASRQIQGMARASGASTAGPPQAPAAPDELPASEQPRWQRHAYGLVQPGLAPQLWSLCGPSIAVLLGDLSAQHSTLLQFPAAKHASPACGSKPGAARVVKGAEHPDGRLSGYEAHLSSLRRQLLQVAAGDRRATVVLIDLCSFLAACLAGTEPRQAAQPAAVKGQPQQAQQAQQQHAGPPQPVLCSVLRLLAALLHLDPACQQLAFASCQPSAAQHSAAQAPQLHSHQQPCHGQRLDAATNGTSGDISSLLSAGLHLSSRVHITQPNSLGPKETAAPASAAAESTVKPDDQSALARLTRCWEGLPKRDDLGHGMLRLLLSHLDQGAAQAESSSAVAAALGALTALVQCAPAARGREIMAPVMLSGLLERHGGAHPAAYLAMLHLLLENEELCQMLGASLAQTGADQQQDQTGLAGPGLPQPMDTDQPDAAQRWTGGWAVLQPLLNCLSLPLSLVAKLPGQPATSQQATQHSAQRGRAGQGEGQRGKAASSKPPDQVHWQLQPEWWADTHAPSEGDLGAVPAFGLAFGGIFGPFLLQRRATALIAALLAHQRYTILLPLLTEDAHSSPGVAHRLIILVDGVTRGQRSDVLDAVHAAPLPGDTVHDMHSALADSTVMAHPRKGASHAAANQAGPSKPAAAIMGTRSTHSVHSTHSSTAPDAQPGSSQLTAGGRVAQEPKLWQERLRVAQEGLTLLRGLLYDAAVGTATLEDLTGSTLASRLCLLATGRLMNWQAPSQQALQHTLPLPLAGWACAIGSSSQPQAKQINPHLGVRGTQVCCSVEDVVHMATSLRRRVLPRAAGIAHQLPDAPEPA